MNSLTIKTLALAAALACSAAQADTLVVSNYTGGGAGDAFTGSFANASFDTVDTQPWQVLNGATSFVAFCVERLVPLSAAAVGAGETYTASAYTNSAVVNLFNGYYASALLSADTAAGFQLALWELVEDDGNVFSGSLDLTGFFQFGGSADYTQSVGIATGMLAGLGAANGNYALTLWDAKGSQDLISAAAVPAIPEPSTYALLAGGLGLVGFMARRRRQG